jgi:16S rRNA (guanine527-N7)-methyltransferase
VSASCPPDVAAVLDVPRETLDRLATLAAAIERWNPAINLIAPGTVATIWTRHIADSAQLWRLRPTVTRTWLDLGSGGGFPGLVIAILASDAAPDLTVSLVESDRRKAAFLAAVSRDLALPARVLPERAEALREPPQDVVSARAFGPLSRLLSLVVQLRHPGGLALLPKGRTYNKELDAAARLWKFDYKLHPSSTDPDAAIIEIGSIHGQL